MLVLTMNSSDHKTVIHIDGDERVIDILNSIVDSIIDYKNTFIQTQENPFVKACEIDREESMLILRA